MAERLRPAGRVRVALLLMPLVVGCTLFQATEKARYETVAADPNRDTQAAVKKHEKALKIIERASNPAYYQCSCVAKKLCNVHKAEQLLHDALVADVRYGPAHNTLGLLHYHQRRLYLAAWEFEYASTLMPSRAEPMNNLGMVYEEAGQLDQAVEFYGVAMEMAAGNPVYLGNLARAQLRRGDSLEAVRGILQQLLMHDTRPEWIGWAEDLLGENPIPIATEGASAVLSDESLSEPQTGPVLNAPAEEVPLPQPAFAH